MGGRMSKPISRAEMKDEVNETWKKCLDERGIMTDYERGFEHGKAAAIKRIHLETLLAQPAPVQVSPLEFVTAVLEKEHLIGKPLIWALWPNEEKNT
jgi:hypothetical protein